MGPKLQRIIVPAEEQWLAGGDFSWSTRVCGKALRRPEQIRRVRRAIFHKPSQVRLLRGQEQRCFLFLGLADLQRC